MQQDLEDKIAQIFRIVLELSDDTDISKIRKINEVKWDSLANVTLVTAIESEFAIHLDYSEVERLTSYQSAILLVKEKVQHG